jgi:MFS transporter, DHA1 family, inner membrane transport protein
MPFPIFAMMLCVFGVGTAEYVVTGVLPEISKSFAVSIPSTGLLVTVYAITVVIGGPLLTVLTVRVPRRVLMAALMSLFIAGNVLAAFAPSFPLLLVGRVASALAHATLFALFIIVATSLVAPERQGRAIANVALGLNLATVLGVPIGTFIGHVAGWRATFLFVAAFSAVATGLLMMTVKTAPSQPGQIGPDGSVRSRGWGPLPVHGRPVVGGVSWRRRRRRGTGRR